MIQTIIPIPMPMPVHSSGNDDPRIILATISAIFILCLLMWIGGWVYRKLTDGDDNIAEFIGKCCTFTVLFIIIISLVAGFVLSLLMA